ncbi:DUF6196 family protein [Terriglobus sp. 2YAB30_2]|uniref:DUF6196 family protein n=1 Tax=Terriglobus sp. 2YAB30_2 TaxID=3233023 RepID=UPI003F9D2CF3
MHISHETDDQIEARLGRVLSGADIVWYDSPFSFFELPGNVQIQTGESAVAFVRDGDVWSMLKPSGPSSEERFGVFSFHFPADVDNSGFVGWLATHLKRKLGTGVFVICGQNSSRGGIFDYWGIPFQLRTETEKLINDLKR